MYYFFNSLLLVIYRRRENQGVLKAKLVAWKGLLLDGQRYGVVWGCMGDLYIRCVIVSFHGIDDEFQSLIFLLTKSRSFLCK